MTDEARTEAATSDGPMLAALLDPQISIPAILVRDGAIADWNRAARDRFVGQAGAPIHALIDPASRDKLATALGAPPQTCEVQARLRGGELVAAHLAVLPVGPRAQLVLVEGTGARYSTAMAQQLLAANAHLANLTRELSRQSAELEAARTRFESLAELREHFVSMLAHDVRGALQGIVLSAELLEQASDQADTRAGVAPLTRTVQTAVARIRRGTRRIQELVDSVLEAARSETGRVALEATALSMRAVAEEACEIYGPIAQSGDVQLAFLGASPAIVRGDRVRLGQVVGNLIENAIRHSPRSGTVTVEVSEHAPAVRLVVRDQGPGIPPALRERVFERFVQGKSRSGSLGLGLYVARQLVELHGGRIHVEDVAPHGAAIVVELPGIAGEGPDHA